MKIGVVADTHSLAIPKQVIDELRTVDMIIHAGDFCTLDDFNVLSGLKKEVKAVYGNMDDDDVRKKLKETEIIKVEDVTIGLFHGEGPAKRVPEFARAKFKNDKVDVIVFGHSHQPLNEKMGDVLLFNPGSPNDKLYAPYNSFGILEINGKNVTGKIVKVK